MFLTRFCLVSYPFRVKNFTVSDNTGVVPTTSLFSCLQTLFFIFLMPQKLLKKVLKRELTEHSTQYELMIGHLAKAWGNETFAS